MSAMHAARNESYDGTAEGQDVGRDGSPPGAAAAPRGRASRRYNVGGVVCNPRILTWGSSALRVPYAVPWTGETFNARTLTVRADGTGLCYRDEKPADRDQHGVLWARMRGPGDGRPKFGKMHPVRQRRAMRALLCRVCAGPASRTSRGWLFVMPGSPGPDVEGSLCTKPPICKPCAQLALRHCPELTDPVAVRVRKPRIWGVLGDQYGPAGPQGGSPTSPPTATSPTAKQQPHAGSSPANSYSNSPAARRHRW
jgi:hypothetical protein